MTNESSVLARSFIERHQELIEEFPNLRFILFACACEAKPTVIIDLFKDPTAEQRRVLESTLKAYNDFHCSFIRLLEQSFELKCEKAIAILDEEFASRVEMMRQMGMVPGPQR